MGLFVCSLCLYGQVDTSRLLDTLRIQESPFAPLDAPRPVQVLTSDQLEASGAGNVAEAIRFMSGIQLRDYGGMGGMKTLDVRSMGAHHTGVVYGGMLIQDTQNGLVDLSQYAIQNLARIRLFNGQPWDLSLPAQAYASASTLILDPKIPDLKRDSSSLSLGMQTGSFGLFSPAMDWSTKLSDKTGIRVSSEWKRWDGGYPYRQRLGAQRDTLIDRANSDMQAFRLEALLQGHIDTKRTWSLHGYAYSTERGLPGASVLNQYSRADRQWDENYFLQGKFMAYKARRYSLLLYGKYKYQQQRYLNPEASTSLGYIDNRYYQQNYDFSLVQYYQWNAYASTALATDYSYQSLDASLPNFAYPRRHQFLLNLSSKWERGAWRLQANVLGTFWRENSRYQSDVKQDPVFMPSVSASVKPWSEEQLYLRVFYKSIFRMPTFNDRYYTFVGAVDLKPEYNRQVNLGLNWGSRWRGNTQVYTTVDFYYNRINDRITAIPTSNIYRWTMVNLGQVGIKGMDVQAQVEGRFSPELGWSLGLRYTLQDARDISPDSYFEKSWIPYAPKHTGSGQVHVHWKSWSMYYAADYTSPRYTQRWNAAENQLEDWLIQDVGISFKHQVWNRPFRIGATVFNIGNSPYAIIRNFPMPRRNFKIQLQIDL